MSYIPGIGGGASGVSSFNTRTGGVTLTSGDVTTALTYTPATQDVVTDAVKGLAPASGGGTANFLRADGTWAAPAGGGGSGLSLPTIYKLTLAHTNATTTPTTIASTIADVDWVHTLVAGKTYSFNIYGQYQTVGLGTGARLNLLGAGGLAGSVSGSMWGAIAQGTNATTLDAGLYSFANAAGSFILTTAVNPINSPHDNGMDFLYTCTTGGTVAIHFATEVAASSAQMNIGSMLVVDELI